MWALLGSSAKVSNPESKDEEEHLGSICGHSISTDRELESRRNSTTTIGDMSDIDYDPNFDLKGFKNAMVNIASGATKIAPHNIYVVSLKRHEADNCIEITYLLSRETTGTDIFILVSTMSTFISSGGMSKALHSNGFPYLSANSAQSFVSFTDKSTRSNITVLQVTQRVTEVFDSDPELDMECKQLDTYSRLIHANYETTEELYALRLEQKRRASELRQLDASRNAATRDLLRRHAPNGIEINPTGPIAYDGPRGAAVIPSTDGSYMIANDPLKFAEKCVSAIRKNLKVLDGLDLDSICILTIVPDGPCGISVVYTLRVTLANVAALMNIISDAVDKGYFKSVLSDKGYHSALSRATVIQSDTSILLQANQKFSGIALPENCLILDFTIPNCFPTFPKGDGDDEFKSVDNDDNSDENDSVLKKINKLIADEEIINGFENIDVNEGSEVESYSMSGSSENEFDPVFASLRPINQRGNEKYDNSYQNSIMKRLSEKNAALTNSEKIIEIANEALRRKSVTIDDGEHSSEKTENSNGNGNGNGNIKKSTSRGSSGILKNMHRSSFNLLVGEDEGLCDGQEGPREPHKYLKRKEKIPGPDGKDKKYSRYHFVANDNSFQNTIYIHPSKWNVSTRIVYHHPDEVMDPKSEKIDSRRSSLIGKNEGRLIAEIDTSHKSIPRSITGSIKFPKNDNDNDTIDTNETYKQTNNDTNNERNNIVNDDDDRHEDGTEYTEKEIEFRRKYEEITGEKLSSKNLKKFMQ